MATNPTAESTLDVQIKNPDTFQASAIDIWHWIEHNAKLVVALIVVLILAAIGYASMQYLKKRQELAAQEAYYTVEAKFQKVKEGYDRAKYKSVMPKEQVKGEADTKAATGDLQKDYGSLVSDLEKVAHDQAGTSAGGQAALLAAQTYLEYKQPERAVELAKTTASQLGAKSLIGQLATVMWGNAVAAKGDCTQAVGIFQQIIDNKAADFLHADASLRSGVCFEEMKQPERAQEMYRKAATSGESTAGQTAKGLLRALEVKMKSTPTTKAG